MPADKLLIAGKVNKNIFKLPSHIKKRLPAIFGEIKENPLMGIRLKGELASYYKLRLGDYRIIYRFDEKLSAILIVKVEHRQGVYR